MCKFLKIICAISILTTSAIAQNEIDHISTLYPSGYGKLAIDGDTLYVNVLNGHGVERYNIADPATPIFIDREEVSGFDQIDFDRRLLLNSASGWPRLIDFSNFDSSYIASSINMMVPLKNNGANLIGNYLLIAHQDNFLRAYDINDISDPVLIDSIEFPSSMIVIGTTKAFSQNWIQNPDGGYCLNVYDISEPNNLQLSHIDTVGLYRADHSIYSANGDTIAERTFSIMQGTSFIFVDYPNFLNGIFGYYILNLYKNTPNGYIISELEAVTLNSFSNWQRIGRLGNNSIYSQFNFELYNNHYMFYSTSDTIRVFEASQPNDLINEIFSSTPAHFGILSSATYGNYILSGAESNGGELLIHEIDDSNHLSLISTVPSVRARNIIIDGSSALCLCPTKISQINLSNPFSPVLSHELSGFSGELLDFANYDSLLFAITDRAYYVIDYDSLSGMTILSQMSFSANSLTSIGQYQTTSVLLEGNLAQLVKISAANPILPVIVLERQFPPDTFQNLSLIYPAVWISGRHGTNILSFDFLDSVAFLGPEYFSDVHQIYSSGDTLYVADGVNGIKIFTFSGQPYDSLRYIGGYSTGNVVNRLSTIGNNFFISDYYSLQHLRWGAPTGLDGPDSPRPPGQFTLMQNYPNPFNSQTTISYYLPYDADITFEIYDLLGRRIETLERGHREAGEHQVVWDAAEVPSGVYFYRIKAGEFNEAKRCLLIK